jgi:hypothetical protein
MPKVEYIVHQEKKILFFDIRDNPDPVESMRVGDQAKAIIMAQPPKSVLLLTDVTRAHYNPEATDYMKEYSAQVTPFVKASAMVGVAGIRNIILGSLVRISGRNIKLFDDLEKAKDWLAEQD